MSDTSLVASYYDQNSVNEHSRLIDRRLERGVTRKIILDAISNFGPNSSLRIADIGGGTGRYAVELTKLGHKVTLSDISTSELAIAKTHADQEKVLLENIVQADARDLHSTFPLFHEEKFDILLLLGPLYHLLEETERIQAIQDCASMTEPGGFVICAFVTKMAHLRDLAQKDPRRLVQEKAFYAEYLQSGKYTRNPAVVSHHTQPVEIRQLFEKVKNLEVKRVVGCEGFLGGDLARGLNGLSATEFEHWIEVVMSTAEDPYVLGASDHIVVVAQRI